MRVQRLALLLAGVVLLACPIPAAAQSEPAQRNCGWTSKVSGDQVNALYPDEAAKYWNAVLAIPPSGHIEIRGRFPKARYTSFHSYDRRGLAIDALADAEILPDSGSTNPFLEGADRTSQKRSYTLQVVNARVPSAGRAPNTLYTENADGSRSSRDAQGSFFTIRVYEPDNGLDDTGGVGLPALAVVRADGSRTALGDCPPALVPDTGATGTVAELGLAGSLPPAQTVGSDPPRWIRHKSALSSYALVYGGAGANNLPITDLAKPLPESGLGENSHNKYVFAVANRTFGEVLLLRARAPSFPSTVNGEPVMGGGQLRYWSFCTNLESTQYLACRNDDAVPLDRDRTYTFAISTAASRPANAREACGVTWLPFGPEDKSVLILRNMLARPDFAEAVQRTEQGTEERVMGGFYPRGTYFKTKADFERRGCAPPEFPAARTGCLRRTMRVTRSGVGPLRLGRTRAQLIRRAGVPRRRTRGSLRWCVTGGGSVRVSVSQRGRSRLVATTARRHRARRGTGRGSRPSQIRRAYPRISGRRRSLLVTPGPRSRVVFGLRRGRAAYVAAVGRRAGANRRRLAIHLRRAGLSRR